MRREREKACFDVCVCKFLRRTKKLLSFSKKCGIIFTKMKKLEGFKSTFFSPNTPRFNMFLLRSLHAFFLVRTMRATYIVQTNTTTVTVLRTELSHP